MENGKIYSRLIDPILKPMRVKVANHISVGENVIDIACGTGAQVFELAKKAGQVVGTDYSESMLEAAREKLRINSFENIEFILADATDLNCFGEKQFDVSTLTLALHQFAPDWLPLVLSEMKRVSNRLIIVDYSVPLSQNFVGWGSKFAEFLAGAEHNKNFRKYYKSGGLNKILPANGIQITDSVFFAKDAFQLVVGKPVNAF